MLQLLQSDDENDEGHWPMWDQRHEVEEVEDEPQRVKSETKPTTEKRVSSVDKTLTDKRKETGKGKLDNTSKSSSADLARYISLGTELVAAVLVGTFLGWVFNRLTGYNGPWALVIGIIIGSAAGFLNMYRAVQELEREEGQNTNGSSR